MSTTTTTTEERALSLLGSGLAPKVVSAALGVSESAISQLLSREGFAEEVAVLRFTNLSRHNERDSKYDRLEDAVLDKLEDCLPLVHRPLELARILTTLNTAKRRGSSAPEALLEQSEVVKLVMPVAIHQHFTTNIQNQVVQAGEQVLTTMQSSSLLSKFKSTKEAPAAKERNYEPLVLEGTPGS